MEKPVISSGHHIYQKDIVEIEGIQGQTMRMIRGMKTLSDEDRLKGLGLFTLEKSLIRGDMITAYKTRNGSRKINCSVLSEQRDIWQN